MAEDEEWEYEKWEYKIVPRLVKGPEEVQEEFNGLGVFGWELVLHYIADEAHFFVFKRPIVEEEEEE